MSRILVFIVALLSLMPVGETSRVMAEEVKCEGTISKVEGQLVSVTEKVGEQKMKIEPATKITSGGKPVSPMDLRVGQKVKCLCDQRGTEMICTSMEIDRDTP